jgi:D-beta-D-heptose 7-phosphate kinase/D-beta-D-heptose 1-phosphate adenosyltransferase
MKRVVVCGGFDPLHIGHVRYINEAKKLGDHLTVVINGDSFLLRKKGFAFMPAAERLEIIQALGAVDRAFVFDSDKDDTIGALATMQFEVFAKGGDRTGPENIPEWPYCVEHGVEVVTNVGGGKVQSSSELTKNIKENMNGNASG